MAINNKGEQEFPDGGDMDALVGTDNDFEDESNDEELLASINKETEVEDGSDDTGNTKAEADDTGEGDDDPADSQQADAKGEHDADDGDQSDGQNVDTKAEKDKFNPEEYSRNVQKRINREVRKRGDLQRQNDELQRRLNILEGRMHQSDSTNQIGVLDNRIRNATSMKNKFLEDGEYAKASQVDNDIMDMKIARRDLARVQRQNQRDMEDPNYGVEDFQQGTDNQSDVEIPQIQRDWITGNNRYQNDQSYAAYVDSTYDALLEEGYDPEHKSLYQELDRRIGRTNDQKPAENRQKKRDEAAPPPNDGKQAPANNKKSSLTKDDIAHMRNWGLDPSDPKVRKEWLRNKASAA